MGNTYKSSGVNVEMANEMKNRFGEFVSAGRTDICRPLNRVGAFASLLDIDLSRFDRPVFVMKSEEPGSKQLLSFERDRIEWIACDLINHLVNDVVVMGASPCAVLDTIICESMDSAVLLRLVKAMARACGENGCVLVGGETSEQPGVLPAGRHILQASALGVVSRDAIVDGSAIRDGDVIVSLASNGLHTNGYSLARRIMRDRPEILGETVGGESFMDALLKPHTAYFGAVSRLLRAGAGDGARDGNQDMARGEAQDGGRGSSRDSAQDGSRGARPGAERGGSNGVAMGDSHGAERGDHQDMARGVAQGGGRGGQLVHGMAHITGGGAHDNLIRILPDGAEARIDLSKVSVPGIFKLIKRYGGIDDAEMLAAFNMGMGLLAVADPSIEGALPGVSAESGIAAAIVGRVSSGPKGVSFINSIQW
ncbi:MAG: phosphoribosylformylglycinamidine cyclo-ligase [Clostridiales bacterium]|jgi:phosphoribosylaminoimidazole synthetase|nr:phosphoribosylformylglycinamidine cyclo-ligase [Clostridiales bacterium]